MAWGIINIETMFGNEIRAYDRERTICDLIKLRDECDGETFVKTYASDHPSQRKLFRYVQEIEIENKVFEFMEIITNEN